MSNDIKSSFKFIVESAKDLNKLRSRMCNVIQEVDGCEGLNCTDCPCNSNENMIELVNY